MQFCDECGSMMVADGEVMVCTDDDCGATVARDTEEESAFVITEEQGNADVIESTADAAFEGKPTATVRCEECGHEKAWYTIKQTASADEPPTRFFKCTECGNRWRDYG